MDSERPQQSDEKETAHRKGAICFEAGARTTRHKFFRILTGLFSAGCAGASECTNQQQVPPNMQLQKNMGATKFLLMAAAGCTVLAAEWWDRRRAMAAITDMAIRDPAKLRAEFADVARKYPELTPKLHEVAQEVGLHNLNLSERSENTPLRGEPRIPHVGEG